MGRVNNGKELNVSHDSLEDKRQIQTQPIYQNSSSRFGYRNIQRNIYIHHTPETRLILGCLVKNNSKCGESTEDKREIYQDLNHRVRTLCRHNKNHYLDSAQKSRLFLKSTRQRRKKFEKIRYNTRVLNQRCSLLHQYYTTPSTSWKRLQTYDSILLYN